MCKNTGRLQLRPHHLLCIRGYQGKGYDASFVRCMNAVTDRLRGNPEERIQLVSGCDDLCEACPNRILEIKSCIDCRATVEGSAGGDETIFRCSTEKRVQQFDRNVMEQFSLEPGTYIWRELCEEIAGKLNPERMQAVCGDCAWAKKGVCLNFG